jgi:hypothetical protein
LIICSYDNAHLLVIFCFFIMSSIIDHVSRDDVISNFRSYDHYEVIDTHTIHSDYFESLPPWRSVSMTGVAETAPSDTVDETIRLNH